MKIVIADYPDVLGRKLEKEFAYVREAIPDAEIEVHPYTDPKAFYRAMEGAAGLLTAFIPLDKAALDRLPDLRAISINATGYNFVDLEETRRRGIPVCAIGEYCTQEVADHTMALLLALDRNLKHYGHDIDCDRRWQYYSAPQPMGLHGRTLGLFGLGKIGRAVARRAQGFGMHVLAFDPYVDAAQAAALDVQLVNVENLLAQADVISNHMNLTAENTHYFDYDCFCKMAKHPIFLNVARGGSVVEADLVRALDEGRIRAAGLDVLEAEKPDLVHCALTGRDNVILTPHAAFYSARSIEALQRMSCKNLTDCLTGHIGDAFRVVNGVTE
ncbi:MAG: NAD(P)-dependent oxidoreductase [Agathobaculum butyriciproducens]|nr:NAD(P)-dependent oxidoreductase [Agathobaculum butyriciproducens]